MSTVKVKQPKAKTPTNAERLLNLMALEYMATQNSDKPKVQWTSVELTRRMNAMGPEVRGPRLWVDAMTSNAIQSAKKANQVEKVGEDNQSIASNGRQLNGKRYFWASLEVLALATAPSNEKPKAVESQVSLPAMGEAEESDESPVEIPAQADKESVTEESGLTRTQRKRAKSGISHQVTPARETNYSMVSNADLADLRKTMHEMSQGIGEISREMTGNIAGGIRACASVGQEMADIAKALDAKRGADDKNLINAIGELMSRILGQLKLDQIDGDALAAATQVSYRQGFVDGWNQLREISVGEHKPPTNITVDMVRVDGENVTVSNQTDQEKAVDLLGKFVEETKQSKPPEGKTHWEAKHLDQLPAWARNAVVQFLEGFGQRHGQRLKVTLVDMIQKITVDLETEIVAVMKIGLSNGSEFSFSAVRLGKAAESLFS